MFKPVSAKEERLLPVYVYGSESLEHQAQISRGKGFMLHSQISVCYSGEGVFTDHNNVFAQSSKRRYYVLYFRNIKFI